MWSIHLRNSGTGKPTPLPAATLFSSIARRLLRRGVVDGERLQDLLRGAKRPEGIFP
jgi:hypothetical protein